MTGPDETSPPLLALSGIGKRFDNGTVALRALGLDVGEHEFLTLLGPSGCGKTTVLRIIAGLAAASDGTIAWRGAGRPATSFVFQEPTLMPWATVAENVALPLRLDRGRTPGLAENQRTRVAAALESVGLGAFAAAYPRELSGGMKMRVSVARAMITQPRLLLMDEPFAALDEITRFRLNDDTLALWRLHRFTTVFVTHSVFESVYLSSRIVVMAPRPGRIVAEFRIDEPYPRDESFRTSPRYNAWCIAVSRALAQAVAEDAR